MEQLIEIVLHPAKYRHVANLPLRFDAAEGLLPYWDTLNARVQRIVREVLVKSGRNN